MDTLAEAPYSSLSGVARVLVHAGKLNGKAAEALVKQAAERKVSFVSALIAAGSVSAGDLAHTLSGALALPVLDLTSVDAERLPRNLIDAKMVNQYQVVVLGKRGNRLFIGGADDDVARARPILEHLGRVIHCGPRGTGNAVKLVTNQLWFIHAAALGEAFALGMANGVELGTLWEAITNSVGDSFVARHDAPSIFAGHYDPSFSLDLCNKDLGLIAELAQAVGAPLPLTDTARRRFAEATERYGPAAAELHVVRQLEEDAQLSMRLAGDWTPPWEA